MSSPNTAVISTNVTVAGSDGDLSQGTTYVLSGSGPTMPYILSNLPGYNLIGRGGGALMNLSGINNIFGNILLNTTSSVGVEQAYSSDPNNINYSANYFSQLTTTGPISQTNPLATVNVSGEGAGNEHETDQVINVGSTTGTATINTDVYGTSSDVRIYYGNETEDPTHAVLLYDSSNAPYPTTSFNIATASESVANVVTITTVAASSFVAGEQVFISGITPNGYDGIFIITGVAGNTFTYADPGHSGLASTTGGTGSITAPNNLNGAKIVVNYTTTAATVAVTQQSEFGGVIGTNWDGAGGTWVSGSPGPTVNYATSGFSQIEIIYNQVVNGVGNSDGSATWKDEVSVTPGVATSDGITKIGSQRLIIMGGDTFSGPVDIQQGVILAQNSTALGTVTGTANTISTTTVEAGPRSNWPIPCPSSTAAFKKACRFSTSTSCSKGLAIRSSATPR